MRIGIIGGGQLGKMMIIEGKKLGFYFAILDPMPDCSAHSIADEHLIAGFDDELALAQLSEITDVVTYEFEHINAAALMRLEAKGKKVFPTAKSLMTIQNKYEQKKTLRNQGIPVPKLLPASDSTELRHAANEFGFPLIVKTHFGGYDGHGNFVIRTEDELRAFDFSKGPFFAEAFVDFEMEVSVLACRGINKELAVYPVGKNIHKDSILFETSVPAPISESSERLALEIARQTMEVFDGVGMFCIEMFVTKDGGILVNEVAPRPHNSGHYTIEGCVCNQFEQHVRAVSNLPLGDTSLIKPTVMRNILGSEGYTGQAIVEGLDKALALKGVHVHVYGKSQAKPKRKLGHITTVADNLEDARELADAAWGYVKVRGAEKI